MFISVMCYFLIMENYELFSVNSCKIKKHTSSSKTIKHHKSFEGLMIKKLER